jgi:hypothetical protein
MIAQDLYRLHQEVERLEEELSKASLEEKEKIKDRLRKVKADRDRMRRALEGTKESPPYRRPL